MQTLESKTLRPWMNVMHYGLHGQHIKTSEITIFLGKQRVLRMDLPECPTMMQRSMQKGMWSSTRVKNDELQT